MVILIEADGISSVACPICGREFKVITMTHLKTHGYSNKEDFFKDYPNAQLVSKEYEESNREIRSQILTKINKSPEQRAKSSARAKEMNRDSYRQSMKGKQGWTDERRKQKSDQIKQVSQMVNTSPKYAEYRERRLKGLSYGKKIPYETQDGRSLVLRSFLECRVCKFLELNNYDFEYESVEIDYKREDKVHKYFPDFYLPKYNLVIEVKPQDRQDDSVVQLKKDAAEREGYNFMFISNGDLKDYNNLVKQINALGAK